MSTVLLWSLVYMGIGIGSVVILMILGYPRWKVILGGIFWPFVVIHALSRFDEHFDDAW